MNFFAKRRVRSSIFLKLFLVVFMTGVVLNLLAVAAVLTAAKPKVPESFVSNGRQYAKYIASQFSDSTKRDKAIQLVKSLGLYIQIESPSVRWSNFPGVGALGALPSFKADPPLPVSFTREPFKGMYFVVDQEIDGTPSKVFVGASPGPTIQIYPAALTFIIFLVTLVLALSFLAIVRLLKPIQDLERGVQALSVGDFKHRVVVKTSDEFFALGNAFNAMTVKVQEAIEMKQQLLLDVSHELRSPIGRAQLALEILNDKKASDRVHRELKQMESMIHSLLESARIASGVDPLRRSHEDVLAIAQNVVSFYEASGCRLVLNCEYDTVPAFFDPDRITTVLRNLVDNAIKYSGSSVEVSVSIGYENGTVKVSVADRGQGIPPEELPRIFEPFYRVDKSRNRSTGGFGLGLSMCYRIIDSHGGKLTVESDPKTGTVFSFTLPVNA